MPKYQLLVCDIAGTILKDNNEVASSFQSVFAAQGIDASTAEINRLMGVHKLEAMQRILAADQPGDFVVATGETHSVRELAEKAFAHAGLDYRNYVQADASLVDASRPVLAGSSARLKGATGWAPTKSFDDMIVELVDHELGQA